jgi:hypothetical protein
MTWHSGPALTATPEQGADMTPQLQFIQTMTAVRTACAFGGRTLQSLALALGLASWCFVGLPTRATAAEPAQDENLAYATTQGVGRRNVNLDTLESMRYFHAL